MNFAANSAEPAARNNTPTSGFDYSALDPALAGDAQAAAGRIKERVKDIELRINDARIATGNDLIAVKAKLEHGQFCKWIAAECGLNLRTAQRHMAMAEMAAKNDIVSLLPAASVYALAAPTTPAAVVNEVLATIAAGTKLPTKIIKDKIATARAADREAETEARKAEIEARKSAEQIAKEKKAKESKAQRAARKAAEEQTEKEKREQEEQRRADRLRPLVQRVAAAIGSNDIAAQVKALGDWSDRDTLKRLLGEAGR